MEAAMTHPVPRWTVAAARQSDLLIRSGRVTLLMLANAATLLVAEVGVQMQRMNGGGMHTAEPVIVNLMGFLMLIGAGWALLVWNGEGRDRRHYHWGMPVSPATQDLWRVAAGAGWLLAGTAVFCLIGVVLGVVDETPALFDYGASFWVNCFTLPLLPYLAASIVTLRANRPFLWIAVLVASFAAVIAAMQLWHLAFLSDVFEWLLADGDYSLGSALFGGYTSAKFELLNQTRAFYIDGRLHTGNVPPVQDYVIANAIWLPIATTLVVLAARRRP
jgi:hypothetical protein